MNTSFYPLGVNFSDKLQSLLRMPGLGGFWPDRVGERTFFDPWRGFPARGGDFPAGCRRARVGILYTSALRPECPPMRRGMAEPGFSGQAVVGRVKGS